MGRCSSRVLLAARLLLSSWKSRVLRGDSPAAPDGVHILPWVHHSSAWDLARPVVLLLGLGNVLKKIGLQILTGFSLPVFVDFVSSPDGE